MKEELNKFLLNDGSLDGEKMQKSWFPQINSDVFLSHSHNDKEKAIALAGWLNRTFGLDVFLDSSVWGSADALLKMIDDKYCKFPDNTTYSYEKRNFSTSHIHMMLSTALTMMIDQTECILFLNTPNSINTSEVITSTKSPWIYHEIAISKFVRKQEPNRPKGIIKKGLFENAQDLSINYKLDMEHLREITQSDLLHWQKLYSQNKENHPLDLLYGMGNLLEQTVLR
ncbi:toll/interleukin-1 receptor domain-containing protein [Mesobacillus maritimus]|uniref:toll/interleukin-1 receptor domain-containing protein n=1 Tax=Mesobacillus maritimus TaxID=1643336 RepID=UPI00204095F8|nr:toll/interleukin-1 receptor domain-containing protein [Mesobacillus maritimus]